MRKSEDIIIVPRENSFDKTFQFFILNFMLDEIKV